MRWSGLALLLAGAPLWGEEIRLADGSAQFDWLSAASFRIVRTWGPPRKMRAGTAATAVFESQLLRVEIEVPALRVAVYTADGKPVADLGAAARTPGKIVFDRPLKPGERVHGKTGSMTASPFLYSTAGYGQMLKGAARYLVNAGGARITAQDSDRIEYFFFYGPTPKEIFDQRRFAEPVPEELPRRRVDLDRLSCEEFRALQDDSLAGELYEIEAGPQWEPYLGAYVREVHDRGLPVLRPLLLQFPRDPLMAGRRDAVMLGDELLVAPRCAASTPVTLPRGSWTDLRTGLEHKGRSPIVHSGEVTVLARNGSIVPMLRGDVIELHYFPRLGAEFFLYEPDAAAYSQMHASQAGDFWRLEIESKVSRPYEWVLHHIGENPRRIRVEAKAGADHILNIPF